MLIRSLRGPPRSRPCSMRWTTWSAPRPMHRILRQSPHHKKQRLTPYIMKSQRASTAPALKQKGAATPIGEVVGIGSPVAAPPPLPPPVGSPSPSTLHGFEVHPHAVPEQFAIHSDTAASDHSQQAADGATRVSLEAACAASATSEVQTELGPLPAGPLQSAKRPASSAAEEAPPAKAATMATDVHAELPDSAAAETERPIHVHP